ncbi:hypothetical protein [Rhodococcus sp. BP22]|uniref:hypothetical protein n=1 Tax=Rhodococcus sp. BP22 TaxID=2758566 RepID=UPI001648CEBD|nr:hypothetical protein [Rhodococcus sp. BP22]
MSEPTIGQPPSPPRNRRRLIIAAAVVGVLVIAVAVTATWVRMSDQSEAASIDWSAFPQTLPCVSVPHSGPGVPPSYIDQPAPAPVRARAVRLENAGPDRLRIELTMAGPPPPPPNIVALPGYDPYYPAPGSLNFSADLYFNFDASLFFDEEADGANGYNLYFSRNLYGAGDKRWTVEGNSFDYNYDLTAEPTPVNSGVVGNTIAFTVDLANFPPLAAGFTSIQATVMPVEYGQPGTDPSTSLVWPQQQRCSASTAAEASVPVAAPTTAPTGPPLGGNSSSENNSDGIVGTPVDPGACADGGICQLSSPSGDYYCTISRTGAFCSSPVGEPLSAGTDARLIKVGSDGETGLLADSGGNSHMQDRQSMQETTLPFGSTMTAYGMTCAFSGETGGAICQHDESGHGFQVSTARYRFF